MIKWQVFVLQTYLSHVYLNIQYDTTCNKKYEQVWKIEIPIVNKDKTCNKKCQTCEYYN